MQAKFLNSAFVFFLMTASSFSTFASVQISTTRVIYRAAEKDVSVQVTNPGKYPVLLQSWIDNGNPDSKPENIHSPFVLTPPLSRVNADSGQTLRLAFIGDALPTDRESLYWLNVLEIPPVADKVSNQIQVAFRSRIKVFYRPTGLGDKEALTAAKALRWQAKGKQLTLSNPTPFYISLLAITFQDNGKKITVPVEMIAPKSESSIEIPGSAAVGKLSNVTVNYINDYGAVTSQSLEQ